MKSKQSGFTLIEIAIVLVIIGLLLGGVLKGQELINSAKVKNLATDFKNIPLYIYGYQDKFKALPGDDKAADTHVSGTVATTPTSSGGVACASSICTSNGIIDGKWNSTTATDESYLFWQQVRLAGLAPGATTGTLTPTNAVGGDIGITNSGSADLPITGLKGSYIICSGAIAGKFAKQLDVTLDDGKTDSGSMMTKSVASVAAEASPVDDTPYTVCMGF